MMVLIIDENTLEIGLEKAYTSFNHSASIFLEKQGMSSTWVFSLKLKFNSFIFPTLVLNPILFQRSSIENHCKVCSCCLVWIFGLIVHFSWIESFENALGYIKVIVDFLVSPLK